MQCACAIFFSVACPALQYFLRIISQTVRFSKKKMIERKIFILIFYTTFCRKHFSFYEEIHRHMIINVHRSSRKVLITVKEVGWAPGPGWTEAEILVTIEISSPDHPARSESLYLLSYQGPSLKIYLNCLNNLKINLECPEISARNYQYSQRNSRKERSSQG